MELYEIKLMEKRNKIQKGLIPFSFFLKKDSLCFDF